MDAGEFLKRYQHGFLWVCGIENCLNKLNLWSRRNREARSALLRNDRKKSSQFLITCELVIGEGSAVRSMVTRATNAKFPHGTDGLKQIGHHKLEGPTPCRKTQLAKIKVIRCRSFRIGDAEEIPHVVTVGCHCCPN